MWVFTVTINLPEGNISLWRSLFPIYHNPHLQMPTQSCHPEKGPECGWDHMTPEKDIYIFQSFFFFFSLWRLYHHLSIRIKVHFLPVPHDIPPEQPPFRATSCWTLIFDPDGQIHHCRRWTVSHLLLPQLSAGNHKQAGKRTQRRYHKTCC